MIRKTLLFLLLMIITVQGVFASAIDKVEYADEMVYVEGRADNGYLPVKIEVLKDGITFNDCDNTDVSDVYSYFSHTYAKKDGSFAFEIPGIKQDNGYLRVTFFDGSYKQASFFTYNEGDAKNASSAILLIANESERAEAIKNFIASFYGELDVDYNFIKSLSAEMQTKLYEDISAKISSDTSFEVFLKNILDEICWRKLSLSPEFEDLERYSESLNLKDSVYSKDYSKLSEENKQSVAVCAVNAKSLEEVIKCIGETVLLKTLKNIQWNDYYGKLSEYAKLLELNLSPISALSDAEKKKVFAALKDDIENEKILNASQINQAIETYVDAYKDVFEGSSNRGSGSGSNGGFSGAVVPGTTKVEDVKKTFGDLDKTPWAKDAINTLHDMGIVNGKDEFTFDPENTVTREEFTAMIVRALELNYVGENKFADVEKERWSFKAISTASSMGIVNGINSYEFNPAGRIIRQDMAVIVYRAATETGNMLKDGSIDIFADKNEINDYSIKAVGSLSKVGIVNGKGDKFEPYSYATRAEAAVIIYRLLKLIGKII